MLMYLHKREGRGFVLRQVSIQFNRINRKTGNRLKQQNVNSETGEVVSREGV